MYVEPLALTGAFLVVTDGPARDAVWYREAVLPTPEGGHFSPKAAQFHIRDRGAVLGLFCPPDAAGSWYAICVSGRVACVAVDLRLGSATFGRWLPQELDPGRGLGLLVSHGLAFGWMALSAGTVLVTMADSDTGDVTQIDPFDPDVDLAWPLPQASNTGGLSLAEAISRGRLPRVPNG